MMNRFLYLKRASHIALLVLLLSLVGMTKMMAQQPNQTKLTDYNFRNLGTIEERVFLLHSIQENDFFSYILSDEEGKIDIYVSNDYTCQDSNANSDFDFFLENLYDEWVAYSNLDKTERGSLFVEWRYQLEDNVFLAINEDFNRQLRDVNASCDGALEFSSLEGVYQFPASVNAGNLGSSTPPYYCPGFVRPTGSSTSCLSTTPNPAFYYMQIAEPGNLNIYMYSTPSHDIDFDCWGPFSDIETACSQLSCSNLVDCSYSANSTENCIINNAQSGQYYILLITNYSNQSGTVYFQNIGTGGTGCSGQKTVTANVNSVDGGTVTGAGVFDCGSSCTLTATANEGYVFMDWTNEDGVVVSTDAIYTFDVWGNRNIIANFVEDNSCYLTFNLNDSNGNGWSGNYLVLNFEDGSFQKLTIPYDMSVFSYALPIVEGSHVSLGWISGLYTEQCSFTVNYSNGNAICYASDLNNDYGFEFDVDCAEMPGNPILFDVIAEISPLEGGFVNGVGQYSFNDTCTLTATANEGYTFMYWTENGQQVSSNTSYSFTVTRERELVAHFALPFSITAEADPVAGGSITGSGEYDYNSTCTLTAVSYEGYTFMYWTENGQQVSSNATYSFTVTCNHELVAHFALPFSITAEADPVAGGSITGSGEYDYNSTCTLTAVANEGYSFMYWTENGQQVSSNATYSFTVTCEHELVAHFALPFSITAEADPVAGGSITGSGEYDYNSTCTLTAVANEGYSFMYWSENGQQVSSNATFSFTVTCEHDLVAHFALSFSITAEANPEVGGSIIGSGEYVYGSNCTLAAVSNNGFVFINWTEDGEVVSTGKSYSFIVTENRTLTANFFQLNPAGEVHAEYYPDVFNSLSHYVKISGWNNAQELGENFSHFRIYRTACTNEGPYIISNTEVLANELHDTVFIDVTWMDAAPGVYKWGVGAVYEGNSGEIIESPISWAEPLAVDASVDKAPNSGSAPKDLGNRASWHLMMTFNAAEAAQYGVAYDGNNFYTSNWGYSSATHNFFKYDLGGNVLEGFEIAGCGTLRGMTYDGQYTYGVANSNTVYCIDLAAHNLVSTFTTSYGAMRGITYDPVRDGFWVIGNWSGNLTLIDRQGAIVQVGPAPESASDLAYYMDENDVEHVFCFNNGTNDVVDYNITTNTLGGSVFNFSSTPGFNAGSSGGCTVASFNNKIAFIGDIQQDPNLIGIYELKDISFPGLFESEIVWSNCLEKHPHCLIEALANPEEGGYVTGTGNYFIDENCTLTATAADGYVFRNWTENGVIVSTDAIFSFTVESDRTLVANFEALTNHWTSESYPYSMFMLGVVTIDGVEQASPTIELGAFCNGECRGTVFPFEEDGRWLYFMAIGGNDGDEITFRLYDHALQQELDLYCYNVLPFEESAFIGVDNPYEVMFASTFSISADINPVEGGTVIGTGDYAPGTSATLVATPNEGYAFNCWTLDGEVVTTEPSYTFTVTGSMNFTANFDVLQLQQLTSGWNWFSTYLEITLDDLKAALLAAFPNVGANALVIKSNSNGNTAWNPIAHRWIGGLTTMDLSQMYMVKVPANAVITLQGVPINPADHPVTIVNGNNWIAFPFRENMSVNNAFAGFPVNGDIIKSNGDGAAAFYGVMWIGGLNTLNPGKGYIYKSNAQESRTFVFGTNAAK